MTTIIVLLILAGVAIAALKNTGLIGKTKDAQLKSLKADAKEKIELAIIEVQTEKTAKGEEVTLKTLSENLSKINNDITADDYTEGAEELTGTVISGSKTFNYSIDKKLKVTIEDEADEKAFRVEAPEITYETVAVNTTKDATTSAPADSIPKGTPLYINIVAKLEGQACTVTLKEDSTKTAPYAVTKNGKYTFTVKGTYNGKTITGEKEVIVDQFNEPQFVKYDAGTWTQAEINALGNLYNENSSHAASSSLMETFGGFKAGDSRNDSVPSYFNNTLYTPAYSGWEILTSEVKNGKTYVTKIVHSGAPENYVHYREDGYRSEWILSGGTRQTGYSVSGKSPRKWDMYIDNSQSSLISEVHAMTYDEAVAITGNTDNTNDIKRNTGACYYLASAHYNGLRGAYIGGHVDYSCYRCLGVRPVVSLQSGVYISGGSGTESDPYILAKE